MGTDLFVVAFENVFRSLDYGASYELVEIEGISHNISSLAVIDTILYCATSGEGLNFGFGKTAVRHLSN